MSWERAVQHSLEAIGAYLERYQYRPHSRLAYRTPSEVAATWNDHDDQSIQAA